MNSYFIAGTDTDVGKTWVTAGLARALRNIGIDVGIMKPFAAGNAQETGFKSSDIEVLSKAAKVNDPENLVNPQFFQITASPYTAMKDPNVHEKVDINLIIQCFKKLARLHESILVEGMGGIMTPILKNYSIADLINDLDLESIIVTRTRIGTLNHTIMTCKLAKQYGIKVRGIIINDLDQNGYDPEILKDDIEDITGISVLGTIPFFETLNIDQIAKTFQTNFDLKILN